LLNLIGRQSHFGQNASRYVAGIGTITRPGGGCAVVWVYQVKVAPAYAREPVDELIPLLMVRCHRTHWPRGLLQTSPIGARLVTFIVIVRYLFHKTPTPLLEAN